MRWFAFSRCSKARLVLPMHAFDGVSVLSFMYRVGDDFETAYGQGNSIHVSQATLPDVPTVLSLLGH